MSLVDFHKPNVNNPKYEDWFANRYMGYFDKITELVNSKFPLCNARCNIATDSKVLAYLLPENLHYCYNHVWDLLPLSRENVTKVNLKKEKVNVQYLDLVYGHMTRKYSVLHSFGMFHYLKKDEARRFVERAKLSSDAMVFGLLPYNFNGVRYGGENMLTLGTWEKWFKGQDFEFEDKHTHYLLTWQRQKQDTN